MKTPTIYTHVLERGSRFPSLSDLYGKLSDAIHAAEASNTLFEGALKDIEEHFEARRLFKLTEDRPE